MRPHLVALVALAMAALLISTGGTRGDVSDPGAPRYVNKMLVDFITPTVAPGKTLQFSFNVNNSYGNDTIVMNNIIVIVGIYRFATQDEVRDVNDSFAHPPLINGDSLQIEQVIPYLRAAERAPVAFEIDTSRKTPHGTYYSQSTYFLRISLVFNILGNSTPIVLKSKGWFTDEQWNHMVTYVDQQSTLNLTYMKSLGVDGIIPDSSFGLKQPIPRWPLVLLIAACGAAAFGAVYYFVLDHPGKYPALEKRFYYLRGKLGELRRQLKNRRRK